MILGLILENWNQSEFINSDSFDFLLSKSNT